MTDCTKVPTLQDIEDSKLAMDDIQSITYSPSGTFVDAKGTTRKTINGLVDPVDAAATQGLIDIAADVASVDVAADEFDANAIDRLNDLDAAYVFTAINNGVWAEFETFTALNQYMVFTGGTAYKPKNSTSLPYIVGATPDTNFVEVVANLSTAQGDQRYDKSQILADATADLFALVGISVRVTDRADGLFDWVSGETPTGFRIVAHDTLPLQLRLRANDILKAKQFGLVGDDSTNNDGGLQQFIDFIEDPSNDTNEGDWQKGIYLYTVGLNISIPIKITGQGDGSALHYTPTTGSMLTLGNATSVVNAILEDFKLIGPSAADNVAPGQDVAGLELNPTGANSVTRNKFNRLTFENLFDPIKGTTAFSNDFDSCWVTQCYMPVRFLTQCNNNNFKSFKTSNCFLNLDIKNSEGNNFDSPLFQNTKAAAGQGSGIVLFQSHVTMDNPYWENTSVDPFIQVGSSAEVAESRSGLTITGGELNEGTGSNIIIVGQTGVHIDVRGIRASAAGIFLGSPGSPGAVIRIESLSSDSCWSPYGEDKFIGTTAIETMRPDSSKAYLKSGGGGGSIIQVPRREGHRLMRITGATNRGPLITDQLTPGEWYTVAYAIRKSAGMTLSFADRTANVNNWLLGIPDLPLPSEDFVMSYFHYKSIGDELYMNLSLADEDIEIQTIAVYKGIKIPQITIDSQPAVYALSKPTSGAWVRGDTWEDISPTVGEVRGGSCTASGIGLGATWVDWAVL